MQSAISSDWRTLHRVYRSTAAIVQSRYFHFQSLVSGEINSVYLNGGLSLVVQAFRASTTKNHNQ